MKRDRGSQQPSIRSFFTSTAGKAKPASGSADPPSKKQRQLPADEDDNSVIALGGADEPESGGAVDAAAAVEQQQAAPAHVERRVLPTERDAAAHGVAQAKLVASRTWDEPAGQPQQQQQAPARSNAARQGPAPKYTPLEQQVLSLQAAHPGVLLLVEVGYKMRMFGQDAEVAAKELGIACFSGHNFMTASFPVPRLSIHVRRLVAAGHKVGVVRQTESAALKAASDNKSAPFTRALTGLFTAATLEAAEKADKLEEASYMEVSQGLESMLGGSSRSPSANYILVVAQDMSAQQQLQRQPTASTAAAAAAAAAAGGLLGLLAVDAGSGDIAYGLGSVSDSAGTDAGSSSGGSSSSGGDGDGGRVGVVMPLEAVLLSLAPADIVVCEPVAAATEHMLRSYMAGASRRCRLERLQPQQWKQQQGSGKSRASDARQPTGGYLDAALMNDLVDFFTHGSPPEGAAAGSSRRPASPAPSAAGAAAAAGGGANNSNEGSGSAASLQFILSLPQPVLAAVAGALAYLQPFGLSEVLHCTSSYRGLHVGGAMRLDGSALRQLEVLESGADSTPQLKGSLLHVLDRCATAAGGRMLRRWLAAPLADRSSINDRQQAVQVLLDSITGSSGTQQEQGSSSGAASVLQHLPKWLSSTRQDLERALARVAAGTAAPAEAVGLWSRLAQLPSALQLPLKQQQPGADAGTAADAGAVPPSPSSEVDVDSLAASVPSRLLVSLLAAGAGPEVAGPAADVLASLDLTAAAKNDFLALFKSQQRFPEVFACSAAVSGAEAHLQELLPKLAASAGVRSLSYVSIQNQGNYLVELPAARTDVPKGWDKVCATKKVCRYHPAEVKAGMAALARAQEQLQVACGAAWTQLLRDFTAAHHAAFRAAVAAVAQLDALRGLAVVASSPGYCRPQFVDEGEPQQLHITDGKHPMLDLALDGAAVANSLNLRWDGTRAAVITGPNMGGKSVLMRQAALILIMAQLGSWVPASSCVLSVFDGVFTRMGASDCLMLGRSTFAEELDEASHILATATNRCLVIIDELGRGTATHDGVAIACATLSHLVCHTQCLSLFVTHYPEVAALATSSQQQSPAETPLPAAAAAAAAAGSEPDGASNQAAGKTSPARGRADAAGCSSEGRAAASSTSSHIAVSHMSYVRHDMRPQQAAEEATTAEAGTVTGPGSSVGAAAAAASSAAGQTSAAPAEAIPVITFLYKLVEGAADESFGLNVAQMAGLPTSVVQRAAVVARQLKVRLGAQQQQHKQHDAQQDTDVLPLLQMTQQVCQVLRAAQQDASQLSELPQLQASASQLLAVSQQG